MVADAPEVGGNLQDHYQARLIVRLKEPISLNDHVRNPVELARMGLQWMFAGRGPLTVGAGQVGGAACTEYAVGGRPDVQFNVMPLSVDKPGDAPARLFRLHRIGLAMPRANRAGGSRSVRPIRSSSRASRRIILPKRSTARRSSPG